MKKTFSLILAAAMIMTFTACNNSENSSDNSSSTVISSEPQNVSAPDSTAIERTDTTVSDDPIVVPDDPNNPADPEQGGGVDNSGLEFPDNRAGRMMKAGIEVGEWGALGTLDAAAIQSRTGVDPANMEECCGVIAMISAVPNEVYVIKPANGKESDVRTALTQYLNNMKDDPMQYPMVQEAWANAVLEEDGDYIYLVCHPDSA